jgi:ABC-2 type transport system permease protein
LVHVGRDAQQVVSGPASEQRTCSGYPFEGLPPWARAIGNALPLTHFIRAARDATLRGAGSLAVLIDGWPIGLALLLATAVTVILQPRRLD